jgi:hypothetical protein
VFSIWFVRLEHATPELARLHYEYSTAIEAFKQDHPELSAYTPRKIELLYCTIKHHQQSTLNQIAYILGKNQSLPPSVALKIKHERHEHLNPVTQLLLCFGKFTAAEIARFEMVSRHGLYENQNPSEPSVLPNPA